MRLSLRLINKYNKKGRTFDEGDYILVSGNRLSDGTMPRVMIADTFNRVFFKTEGYTLGLGEQILGALGKM